MKMQLHAFKNTYFGYAAKKIVKHDINIFKKIIQSHYKFFSSSSFDLKLNYFWITFHQAGLHWTV